MSVSLSTRTQTNCWCLWMGTVHMTASTALYFSERLLAVLDDLYVLTTQDHARKARDTVVQAVQYGCGIASNVGRTRVYSRA